MAKGQSFQVIGIGVVLIMIAAIMITIGTKITDDLKDQAETDATGVTTNFEKTTGTNNTNATLAGSLNVVCTVVELQQNVADASNITLAQDEGIGATNVSIKCFPDGQLQLLLRGNSTNDTTSTFWTNYTSSERTGSVNASAKVGIANITGAANMTTFFSLLLLVVILSVIAIFAFRGRGGGDGGGGGGQGFSMPNLFGSFRRG